jgi:hypothetical protein
MDIEENELEQQQKILSRGITKYEVKKREKKKS